MGRKQPSSHPSSPPVSELSSPQKGMSSESESSSSELSAIASSSAASTPVRKEKTKEKSDMKVQNNGTGAGPAIRRGVVAKEPTRRAAYNRLMEKAKSRKTATPEEAEEEEEVAEQESQPPTKRKLLIWLLVGGLGLLFLVLAVLTVVYFLYGRKAKPQQTQPPVPVVTPVKQPLEEEKLDNPWKHAKDPLPPIRPTKPPTIEPLEPRVTPVEEPTQAPEPAPAAEPLPPQPLPQPPPDQEEMLKIREDGLTASYLMNRTEIAEPVSSTHHAAPEKLNLVDLESESEDGEEEGEGDREEEDEFEEAFLETIAAGVEAAEAADQAKDEVPNEQNEHPLNISVFGLETLAEAIEEAGEEDEDDEGSLTPLSAISDEPQTVVAAV